jgi:hypothetical protein
MRIDGSGNVGIGTTSPSCLIDARGGTAAGSNTLLAIGVADGALGREASIDFGATFSSGWPGADVIKRYSGRISYGSTGGVGSRDLALKFFTADKAAGLDTPTERMRIDANGNVGIGATVPSERIHVEGSSSGGNIRVLVVNTATNGYSALSLLNDKAGIWRNGSAQSGYAGNSSLNLGCIEADPIGFVTNNAERMRIDSSGNVGIGGTANAAAILDVASTTKGFLPPRMTNTQRNAIATPPAGLVIYNTTTNNLNFYNGTAWTAI